MTSKTDKLRAVFLTALMIGSVFAAGVAFTGSAAAQTIDDGSVSSPVQSGETTQVEANLTDLSASEDYNLTVSVPSDVDITGTSNVAADSGSPATGPEVHEVDDQTVNVSFTSDGSGTAVDLRFDATVEADEGDYDVTAQLDEGDDGTYNAGPTTLGTLTVDDSSSSVRKATHYVNGTNGSIVELAFDENVNVDQDSTFTIAESGGSTTEVAGDSVDVLDDDGDQRVVINQSGTSVNNAVTNVTVDQVDDDAGNELSETTYDITIAPDTINPVEAGDIDSYAGTNVALEGNESDSFEIDGEDFSRTRGAGDGSQVYVLDTDDLSTGDYNITTEGGDGVTATMTLEDLGLDVESDEDSYDTNDDVTATATAGDIDRNVDAVLVDSDGEDTSYEAEGYIDSDGEATLDFGQVDAEDVGNYTVEVTDANSGVTAESDEIEVTEAANDDTEFVNIEPAARGDIATVNVSLTETTEANVTIGEYADSNYQANLTVEDGNEDGYVEFNVNTYTMGNQTGDVQSAFYVPGDSDDSVTSVELTDGSTLSEPIADGTYRTSVKALDAEDTDDVSRLSITESEGFTDQNIWTAPRSDELGDFPTDATLTQDDSITQGDWVVHEIQGEGVFGLLENASNNGDVSDTQALLNAANHSELSLTVEQTEASVGPNADPKTLNYTEALQNENAAVVTDAENGTVYVAADLDNVNTGEDDPALSFGDDAYNASVTLNATTTNLADDDSSVSAEYSTDELEESLTQDVYNVTNAENQTLTAESNAADGTEYNLMVESTETEGDGFIEPENAASVEDGELTFEVDFTDASVGDEFSVTLEGLEEDDSATGNVVEDAGGEETTTEEEETTTEEEETTTEEEETTTEEPEETTEEPEETTTEETGDDGGDDGGESGGSIPGFGVGIALVALLGAALLALRE